MGLLCFTVYSDILESWTLFHYVYVCGLEIHVPLSPGVIYEFAWKDIPLRHETENLACLVKDDKERRLLFINIFRVLDFPQCFG